MMQHRNRGRSLELETLEDRCCPSGVVIATLATDGTLNVKGDAGDNWISISAPVAGIIRVEGYSTLPGSFDFSHSTSVNGVRYIDFAASSVARINLQLKDGNDNASISDISLPDKLTIADDHDDDTYMLSNLSLPTGSVNITTGGDDDFVSLDGVTAALVKIDLGSGWNSAEVLNSLIASLNIKAGDLINIDSTTLGALAIDSGGGNDSIALTNTTVSGALNVKAGDGFDVLYVANFTAGSGGVMDGGGKTDVFQDGGGNFGFSTIGFEGFI